MMGMINMTIHVPEDKTCIPQQNQASIIIRVYFMQYKEKIRVMIVKVLSASKGLRGVELVERKRKRGRQEIIRVNIRRGGLERLMSSLSLVSVSLRLVWSRLEGREEQEDLNDQNEKKEERWEKGWWGNSCDSRYESDRKASWLELIKAINVSSVTFVKTYLWWSRWFQIWNWDHSCWWRYMCSGPHRIPVRLLLWWEFHSDGQPAYDCLAIGPRLIIITDDHHMRNGRKSGWTQKKRKNTFSQLKMIRHVLSSLCCRHDMILPLFFSSITKKGRNGITRFNEDLLGTFIPREILISPHHLKTSFTPWQILMYWKC